MIRFKARVSEGRQGKGRRPSQQAVSVGYRLRVRSESGHSILRHTDLAVDVHHIEWLPKIAQGFAKCLLSGFWQVLVGLPEPVGFQCCIRVGQAAAPCWWTIINGCNCFRINFSKHVPLSKPQLSVNPIEIRNDPSIFYSTGLSIGVLPVIKNRA